MHLQSLEWRNYLWLGFKILLEYHAESQGGFSLCSTASCLASESCKHFESLFDNGWLQRYAVYKFRADLPKYRELSQNSFWIAYLFSFYTWNSLQLPRCSNQL